MRKEEIARHDMTVAVKVALNLYTTNQPNQFIGYLICIDQNQNERGVQADLRPAISVRAWLCRKSF